MSNAGNDAKSDGLLSYEEASAVTAAWAAGHAERPATEQVELGRARDRVLGAALRADEDQPAFARSTRDGFACRAAEADAHTWLTVAGSTHAGQAPGGALAKHAAWEVMTGAAMPEGADAVAMLEHVEREGERIRLEKARSLEAGENVVACGAQARAGDVLLEAGAVIGAAQIALAAACGASAVEVFRQPRVAILTTGDELVPVDAKPGPGQIRNSNGPMLAAMVRAAGGEPWVLPRAADTEAALERALEGALSAPAGVRMLLVSGGVSAGKYDLVEPALERQGAKFHFTGVRMQPGKPLVFGEVPAEAGGVIPFFGLPGNPVSSAVTFLLFGARVLGALAGKAEAGPQFAMARLREPVKAKLGLTRFLPARCVWNPAGSTEPEVAAVPWQGSGDQAAFARSNCFVVVPETTEGLAAGALVRILLT
ncbi:MAG TPA: gephyrin-like molybdotransferase Glp [Terracidiphilus sp.]|nr:gephyrin-like molybdotransferase Glp [Terracidiphilus sp.]